MLYALLFAFMLIALLSLLLTTGSGAARLLLDMGENSLFTYPFSIQNLMYLLFALGVGEAFFRRSHARREMEITRARLLPEDPQAVIVRTDLPALRHGVLQKRDQVPEFLCRVVDECVLFFNANDSVAKTQDFLHTMVELELHRTELRYTNLRYLSWVLPTIGFFGTVIGIANALEFMIPVLEAENASAALEPVVMSLATAFNTTIVALFLNAILVFLVQGTQQYEEEAINESAEYCLRNLINRLYVPRD